MHIRPCLPLAMFMAALVSPGFAQTTAPPSHKRGIELRAQKWILPPAAETSGPLTDAAKRRRESQEINYETRTADTKANGGEVYGHVTIALSALLDGRRDRDFASMMESLADFLVGIFNTKEGTYLLSVDLYDHARNRIASEPVITATVKEKRFLWFVVERNLDRAEQIITEPLSYYEVTSTTNKITAILTAHYTSKQAFDAESYKKAIDTYKALGPVLALEPLPETTSAVLGAAKSVLDLIVSKKEDSREIRKIDLNFADMRGPRDSKTPLPKYVKFRVPDQTDRRDDRVMAVAIDLSLSSSKFGALSERPSSRNIIQNAKVLVGAKEITLRNFLTENGSKELQALVAALDTYTLNEKKDGKYKLENLRSSCARVRDALYALFNNKDAVYLQWAFLTEYWSQFSERAASERGECYPDEVERVKYQLPLPGSVIK